jgi:hypothetical protein
MLLLVMPSPSVSSSRLRIAKGRSPILSLPPCWCYWLAVACWHRPIRSFGLYSRTSWLKYNLRYRRVVLVKGEYSSILDLSANTQVPLCLLHTQVTHSLCYCLYSLSSTLGSVTYVFASQIVFSFLSACRLRIAKPSGQQCVNVQCHGGCSGWG